MLATLALPKCALRRNWEALVPEPMAEAHRLLARPSPSPFPAVAIGPGSLGRAAWPVVGLTGPLCIETETPFMGDPGPSPVENKCRP